MESSHIEFLPRDLNKQFAKKMIEERFKGTGEGGGRIDHEDWESFKKIFKINGLHLQNEGLRNKKLNVMEKLLETDIKVVEVGCRKKGDGSKNFANQTLLIKLC